MLLALSWVGGMSSVLAWVYLVAYLRGWYASVAGVDDVLVWGVASSVNNVGRVEVCLRGWPASVRGVCGVLRKLACYCHCYTEEENLKCVLWKQKCSK